MVDTDLKKIGIRLRQIRKTLGFKQKEFSEKFNISVTTISDMETGKSRPGFDFLFKISNLFEINLNYVLFEEGEIFRNSKDQNLKKKFLKKDEDEDVKELLWYLSNSKYVCFNILAWFRKFYNQEEESIKQDLEKGEKIKSI